MSESSTREPQPDPAGSNTPDALAQQQDEAMERGSSILSEPVEGADSRAASITHLSSDSEMHEDDMQTSPSSSNRASRVPTSAPRRELSPVGNRVPRSVWNPAPLHPTIPRIIPQIPRETPLNFYHELIHLHPWAPFVRPRELRFASLTDHEVTNELPLEDYRHIPTSGYLRYKFTKSLFPFVNVRRVGRAERIPFIELQTLEAAIRFRQEASVLKDKLLSGVFTRIENRRQQTPLGKLPTLSTPPPAIQGRRPVLYQVVATNRGQSLVLEAKDFFIPGPDMKELQCITLDQYATNIQTEMRGFDKSLVSVKDFVWVWTIEPSPQALRDPEMVLERARSPRTYSIESDVVSFFRAASFAFVTPHVWAHNVLGNVIRILRKHYEPVRFTAAFEGTPETVIITPAIADFPLDQIAEDEMIVARTRRNVSTAMRFSEPAVSVEARKTLCESIRYTVPCHPREGMLPLRVSRLGQDDIAWLQDRANQFDNFIIDPTAAKRKMGHLFNATCSGLAAVKSERDDRLARWVHVSIPSLKVYPLQLFFTLVGMSSERGWEKGRPIEMWIDGVSHPFNVKVQHVDLNSDNRQLRATLLAYPWSHKALVDATERLGTFINSTWYLHAVVRLSKGSAAAEPAYEAVARMELFDHIQPGTPADRAVNRIYGLTPATCAQTRTDRIPPLPEDAAALRIRDRHITLSADQRRAIEVGCSNYSIVAIQAAFGTGKTMVGAFIAAHLVRTQQRRIVVTASTNAAVAQFARTLLEMDVGSRLLTLRFVSETVAADDTNPLAVDLNEALKRLGDDFAQQLSSHDKATCQRFRDGRLRYEYYRGQINQELTEQQRDEYILAEKDVSETINQMVKILFRVAAPHVICLTTSSLLNTSGPKGLFEPYLPNYTILISDEASQIPEPVLIAMANRMPQARHICIGDVHQLDPHIRCPRSSNLAKYGAKSTMHLLMTARAIPVAPLVTTYRAHPQLNDLANNFVYEGTLQNGAREEDRAMLLNVMRVPDGRTPFLMLDVAGNAERAASRSYFNDAEAEVCRAIVERLRARHINSNSLCILTFYKEQLRRLSSFAQDNDVEIATVDSIQGREKDIVILLTTRTDMDPDTSEFLDDRKRLNVALTRARHGLFLLGHVASLSKINSWATIIRWADNRQALVQAAQLSTYLPPQ